VAGGNSGHNSFKVPLSKANVGTQLPRLKWQLKAFLPVVFALFNGLLLFLLATLSFSVPERDQVLEVAAAGAVVVCAALLIGLALAVGRPMVDLQHTIARIREGDLNARVKFADRNDEVGDLGRSFNEMVAELRNSREEIHNLHRTQMSRAEHLATLGEMAAGLAHEIRNPLAGIAGVIEIVGRDLPPSSPAHDVLKDMRAEVQHINRILTDLLSTARPKQAEFRLADLNSTAEHAVLIAREQAREKDIKVELSKAENLPLVLHDENQITQVLLNLLLNGIQAVDSGGGIRLELGRQNGSARITVSDTGQGISPENLPNIFLPFFTTKGQGTGLGLPLARRIVENHGGHIAVTSTVGEGSQFTVLLPLPDDQDTAAALQLQEFHA
jgi:signal transduction histidine kinase